jgi:hypothetical protein
MSTVLWIGGSTSNERSLRSEVSDRICTTKMSELSKLVILSNSFIYCKSKIKKIRISSHLSHDFSDSELMAIYKIVPLTLGGRLFPS